MSRYRSHRLAGCACAAPGALILTGFAAADPEPPVREDFIKCNVLDPEIFNHVFAYHEAQTAENPMASTGKLMIGVLKGNPGLPPYNEAKVFLWGPNDDVDPEAVLPPLGDTSNGPEIGFDGTEGYEIVYTKQDNDGTWFHARAAANQCSAGPAGPECFEVLDFQNDEDYDNRWSPWVTQNVEIDPPEPARITYNAADDPTQLQAKRKAFRVLEGTDLSDEIIIAPNGGPDVATVGHWARID